MHNSRGVKTRRNYYRVLGNKESSPRPSYLETWSRRTGSVTCLCACVCFAARGCCGAREFKTVALSARKGIISRDEVSFSTTLEIRHKSCRN